MSNIKCRWSLCDKELSSYSNRTRHEKKCKKGEFQLATKDLTCPNNYCQKKFTKTSNFKRHLPICKPKEKKSFPCPYEECNHVADKQSRLNRHLSRKHSKKVSFNCYHCGKSYVRSEKYKDHVKNYHP